MPVSSVAIAVTTCSCVCHARDGDSGADCLCCCLLLLVSLLVSSLLWWWSLYSTLFNRFGAACQLRAFDQLLSVAHQLLVTCSADGAEVPVPVPVAAPAPVVARLRSGSSHTSPRLGAAVSPKLLGSPKLTALTPAIQRYVVSLTWRCCCRRCCQGGVVLVLLCETGNCPSCVCAGCCSRPRHFYL